MLFSTIIEHLKPIEVHGDRNVNIISIGTNSRDISEGQCFIAIRGTQVDGHTFITDAISKGASAIICEKLPDNLVSNVCYVLVENTNVAMGVAASIFYNNPSKQLKLVGVTGTNGKTTTVTLLHDLFQILGYKVGLISTVVYKIDNEEIESTHTTPDAITLNKLLHKMVDAGCEYCFMEVSSHAIVQKRIEGLHFAGAVFTNITHDHLDYHKTFDEYLKAKKSFFDSLSKDAFALTNSDERNGKVMVQNTKAKVKTYGLRTPSDFKCKIVEQHLDGMLLNINGTEFWTTLIGDFNAYNISAIYGTAISLGASVEEVVKGISLLKSVAGRFEYVKSKGGIIAIVDYAHTPDALQNVIDTINRLRVSGQQLITVFGCGGNRDAAKRPVMARIATENSDKVIMTSDNPRKEDPEAILKDMYAGVSIPNRKKTLSIVNRREAIKTSVSLAEKDNIILVAGKGHENYQIIGEVKIHFDDKETLIEIFNELEK